MHFSEKLKVLRKEKHITQEQLADQLDVSRQAVSKWESGVAYPETEKMIQLAKLLDVSLDYLLFEEKDQQEKKETDVVYVNNGTISITTFDASATLSCISVKQSKIVGPKEDEPSYVLNGITKITFWGEHSTILGFYATQSDVQKEIEAINKAIGNGDLSYQLQYCVDIEFVGLFGQPKLKG